MVIVGQIRHLFISFFRKFCIIFNYFVKKYATRDILNKSCEEQCNIYFGRKEMDIVSSFTARLNELMKETGLTPKQISESTGIDLTELMHWKSDKNKKLPSTRNLLKLAIFLRCSFAYMLGLENENSLPNPRRELPVFSERLCKILEKKQLKVFVLKRTGKIQFKSSINNWKTGRTMPNVFNLVCLAETLNCSVDYLLGRGD